jgi:hypothetical protein
VAVGIDVAVGTMGAVVAVGSDVAVGSGARGVGDVGRSPVMELVEVGAAEIGRGLRDAFEQATVPTTSSRIPKRTLIQRMVIVLYR